MYRVFSLEIVSFVIRIAVDAIKAELIAIGKEVVGLMIDSVENTTVKLESIKISEIIRSFSIFLIQFFYSFLYHS